MYNIIYLYVLIIL